MKNIVIINGSPRKNGNTAELLHEAERAALSKGYGVKFYNLYGLKNARGCISCFGCKLAPNLGKCVVKDDFHPILNEIRSADGFILGSPNYLGDISAALRALYERLIFQYITYKNDPKSYNFRSIPVVFLITCNAPESAYCENGMYSDMLKTYEGVFTTFIGDTASFICGQTRQVADYSKYGWDMFDADERMERSENVFPGQKKEFAELVLRHIG